MAPHAACSGRRGPVTASQCQGLMDACVPPAAHRPANPDQPPQSGTPLGTGDRGARSAVETDEVAHICSETRGNF